VTAGRPDSGNGARRREAYHAHDHGGLAGRAWTREEALGALEAPERRQSQDPGVLWTRVGLARGATVVDVGAGTGFFAVAAARRVGHEGRVYAVDLSEPLVELLRERRDRESLPQLRPLRNTLTSIPLPSEVADVVLLANVLHDIPVSTLSEAVRLVKPRGRFVNVDWKKEETPGGPPLTIRLTPDEAEQHLEKQGLIAVERWEFGPWHYGLVLKRSTRAPHR
jgi:ubiquinone/menaquinone biosynthesis C-methylase UbiE